jgi:hypothetical protein
MENAVDTSGGGEQPPSPPATAYWNEVHLEMVVVLVAILLVLVGVGWSLRPQSSGFPNVPENVSLSVQAQGVTTVSETLTRRSDNSAVLEVQAVTKDQLSVTGPWTLAIGNLEPGHICTPYPTVTFGSGAGALAIEQLSPFHVSHPSPASTGGPPVVLTDVTSSGPFYVRMCWSSNAPVSLNGSYLSAQFPFVTVDPGSAQVSRQLLPDAGDTADYVIQSQTTPSSAASNSWSWSGPASNDSVRLSAVNVSGAQHDNFRAFLSGVTLGIAGGALIAIIQEFIAPLSRRRDARHLI